MKNLLLAGLLAVGVTAPTWGQQLSLPLDSTTHKITYSAVVQVPGATQAQLYGRALKWLATVEAHTTNAPPVTDAASGTLSATVGFPFTGRAVVGSIQATLWRQISVTVKDGKAKYEASDFEVQPYVATASALSPPSKAQTKLTPAEEYLNRGNSTYYDKKGQPKAYAGSILDAVSQQTAAQVASLKVALAKSNDF